MKLDKLEHKLQTTVEAVVYEFEVKQGVEFSGFVGNDIVGLVSFNDDLFFNLSDIVLDLFTNQPIGLIIEWYYDCLDNQEKTINYKSYVSGLRFKDI